MSRSGILVGAAVVFALALPAAPVSAFDPCDLAGPPGIPSPTKAGCKVAKGVVEEAPSAVTDPGKAATEIVTPLTANGGRPKDSALASGNAGIPPLHPAVIA